LKLLPVAGLLIALFLPSSMPVQAAEAAPEVGLSWEKMAPMALPRQAGATAVVGDVIYTLGGIETGGSFSYRGVTLPIKTTGAVVESYNIRTGQWSTRAPLPYLPREPSFQPEGRFQLAAAAVGNTIFTFGGASLDKQVRDTIDAYDVTADRWTAGVARLPKPLAGLAAVTVGDLVYLFGGSGSVDVFDAPVISREYYVFNPRDMTVAPKGWMSVPRTRLSAIPWEGNILLSGGTSGYGAFNNQLYDPLQDRWTNLPVVSWERAAWSASGARGVAVILGGRDDHYRTSREVNIYHETWKKWHRGSTLLQAREDAFVAALGDTLYVMGGRDNGGVPGAEGEVINSAERLVLPSSLPAPVVKPAAKRDISLEIKWTEGAKMPRPRMAGATALSGKVIYTLGGIGGSAADTVAVEAYDTATRQWKSCAPMPQPRANFPAAAVGGKIFTFGGAAPDLRLLDSIDMYDIAADKWTAGVARLPVAMAGASAVNYGGKVYLFGGCRSPMMFVHSSYYFNTTLVFDPADLSLKAHAPMPVARNMTYAGALVDNLYVIGGMQSPGATFNGSYNPGQNTWQTNPEMPEMRGGHGGAVVDDKILIIGGEYQKSVLVYDPHTQKWTFATEVNWGRNVLFIAVVDGVIYLMGGSDESGNPLPYMEVGRLRNGEVEITVPTPTPSPTPASPTTPATTPPASPATPTTPSSPVTPAPPATSPAPTASPSPFGCAASAVRASGLTADFIPLITGVVLGGAWLAVRRKRP
jgi:N-acetylneuraminic acid mutarotase